MAGDVLEITETIIEPSPIKAQTPFGERYPWVFTFTGEDVLEVTSWSAAAGVRIALQGRVHTAPLKVIPFTSSHTPNSDRTPVTTVHSVPTGELLNLIVFCDAGAPLMGQTIVRVAVRRGAGAAFTRLGVLIQGPITASAARAFPGSEVQSPLEGEPAVRQIVGSAPAVNVGHTETVPTNARWELLTFRATLTGVPTVNVVPQLVIDDGANIFYSTMSLHDPALGFALIDLSWATGQATYLQPTAKAFLTMGLPTPTRLLAGNRIRTTNAGPNNQFSGALYSVREWLDV